MDSLLLGTAEAPTAYDLGFKILMIIARLWVGIIVGVLLGWIWKPKWADFGRNLFNSKKLKDNFPSSSCFVGSISSLNSFKFQLPRCLNLTSNCGDEKEVLAHPPTTASISRFVAFNCIKNLSSFVTLCLLNFWVSLLQLLM